MRKRVWIFALLLPSLSSLAAEDRSTYPMCYRVFDAQQSCEEAFIAHVGSNSARGKEAVAALSQFKQLRAQIPTAGNPAESEAACAGHLRASVLNSAAFIVSSLRQEGDQVQASKCAAAMESIR